MAEQPLSMVGYSETKDRRSTPSLRLHGSSATTIIFGASRGPLIGERRAEGAGIL